MTTMCNDPNKAISTSNISNIYHDFLCFCFCYELYLHLLNYELCKGYTNISQHFSGNRSKSTSRLVDLLVGKCELFWSSLERDTLDTKYCRIFLANNAKLREQPLKSFLCSRHKSLLFKWLFIYLFQEREINTSNWILMPQSTPSFSQPWSWAYAWFVCLTFRERASGLKPRTFKCGSSSVTTVTPSDPILTFMLWKIWHSIF